MAARCSKASPDRRLSVPGRYARCARGRRNSGRRAASRRAPASVRGIPEAMSPSVASAPRPGWPSPRPRRRRVRVWALPTARCNRSTCRRSTDRRGRGRRCPPRFSSRRCHRAPSATRGYRHRGPTWTRRTCRRWSLSARRPDRSWMSAARGRCRRCAWSRCPGCRRPRSYRRCVRPASRPRRVRHRRRWPRSWRPLPATRRRAASSRSSRGARCGRWRTSGRRERPRRRRSWRDRWSAAAARRKDTARGKSGWTSHPPTPARSRAGRCRRAARRRRRSAATAVSAARVRCRKQRRRLPPVRSSPTRCCRSRRWPCRPATMPRWWAWSSADAYASPVCADRSRPRRRRWCSSRRCRARRAGTPAESRRARTSPECRRPRRSGARRRRDNCGFPQAEAARVDARLCGYGAQ